MNFVIDLHLILLHINQFSKNNGSIILVGVVNASTFYLIFAKEKINHFID